ncbi:hypothetical protein OK016_27075 [Vibrio chagasii]|nr:hypothetical protein [Vibrio chagasii]
MLILAVDDAPFGGIGESGQGNYHGKKGLSPSLTLKQYWKPADHRVKYLFSRENNELKDGCDEQH